MTISEESLREDILRIGDIPFLPLLLEIVCLATGMGFAAVARVTEARWIAGGVRDEIRFGLGVGGELPVETTICHEIRQSETPVIIEHVAHDAAYCGHHTPAMYGFESYISYPIFRNGTEFFGTLCAIDPKAAQLNTPLITGLFESLTGLIAGCLDGIPSLDQTAKSRLEMYAGMELDMLRRDLAAGSFSGPEHRTQLLSLKIGQLLLAIDPKEAFLS